MDANEDSSGRDLASKPDHVPDELVYDYDLWTDPGMSRNPHARLQEVMAEAPPLFWTPRSGGFWVMNRFKLALDASLDWRTFSSTPVHVPNRSASGERTPAPVPLLLDPPAHKIYRTPLNRPFAPQQIARLESDARKLVGDLIDAFAVAGTCEAISQLAEPLPVTIFLQLAGLPTEHLQKYRELVKKSLETPGDQHDVLDANLRETAATMRPDSRAARAAGRRSDQPALADHDRRSASDLGGNGRLLHFALRRWFGHRYE
jgi:cytochrome P450